MLKTKASSTIQHGTVIFLCPLQHVNSPCMNWMGASTSYAHFLSYGYEGIFFHCWQICDGLVGSRGLS